MRTVVFCIALLLSGAMAGRSQAQPTMQNERTMPLYYQGTNQGNRSFPLPGHRYLHCGLYKYRLGHQLGPMISVTKRSGDTVRFAPVATHPPGPSVTLPIGLVQESDYSLFMACEYIPSINGPTATDNDSLLLMRVDTLGRIRWRKAYHINQGNGPRNMIRTGDGYLLCTNRNAFPTSTSQVTYLTPNVTKFDFQGNVVWERSMGSRGYGGVGEVGDLVACPDGSYLAIGNADNGSPYTPGSPTINRLDYCAVRFRANGDTIRTYRFGQPNTDQQGLYLRHTPDGGYAVTGIRYRPVGSGLPVWDAELYKLDSLVRPQWRQVRTWSGIQGSNASRWFGVLQPLVTGDILAGGRDIFALSTTNTTTGSAGQLTCYTPTGGQRWDFQRRYQNGERTYFTSMVNHADGAALLTGVTGASYLPNRSPYYAYSTYLANVGVPYVPDLCARPPVAAFSPGTAVGNPNELVVFDLSLPGPRYGVLTAWRWDWGDGTRSDGQYPGNHLYATVPLAGTRVTLTVTNNLGCISTRTEYPFALATRAARELQARATLYPNPAQGRATLTVPGLRSSAPVPVAVLNALGQVVGQQQARPVAGTLTVELDLSGLAAGVYTVRVQAAEGPVVKRLVRE